MDQIVLDGRVHKTPFALTGDAEIDDVCPSYPRILSEVSILQIDGARLMLVGGLCAPIIARRLGALDVMQFLSEIDGSRSLHTLCAPQLPTHEERKRLLYFLLRSSLLEQPSMEAGTSSGCQQMDSFLAKVMDQTRIHNRRQDVIEAFQRPVGVVGTGPFFNALQQTLSTLGLEVRTYSSASHVPPSFSQQWVIIVLDADSAGDALVHRLQRENVYVLLVCPHGDALDIGPILSNRGTCTIACYRATCIDRPYILDPKFSPLWLANVCSVMVLLNSGTSPLSLINNFMRYQVTPHGISTSNESVARRFALGNRLESLHTTLEQNQMQRLDRHSKTAVPPRRLIGVKSHDVHYAPHNISAAKHFPLPHADECLAITASNATSAQTTLLRLIANAFGYWQDANGNTKRICPSGGNLGAAECLVLWRDQTNRRATLFRYVPIHGRLEPIGHAPFAVAQESGAAEYEIMCISNTEKTRHKYFDFGMSLAFLDGGISAAFMQAGAQAADQPLAFAYSPIPEQWVRDILHHRRHYYSFVWRANLASVSHHILPNLDAFDRLLHRRRASRDCRRLAMKVDQIAELLEQNRPTAQDGIAAALLQFLRPVLIVEQGGDCISYEFMADGSLRQLIDSDITVDGPEQELLSQRNLSQAAARVFMLADLVQVLRTFGDGGHDQLLTLTGQWIGGFWLALEAKQHPGCPAGAMIESDLLSNLPSDFANLFSLFAFTFGQPMSAVA